MNKLRLILRLLFIPLWALLFLAYFPAWAVKEFVNYFSFQDYLSDFYVFWDRVMFLMKLKTK